ncbi:MAG TPA: aminotransferase class III-fold pyridoxal phosphate-dependent enzyme [Miltoncostaeaceae bacterium]|nr:aminotransferase class III-fold pyridoxal phosphate-dependent enzyme [Miltoncostaeaceae bacterium]
MASVGGHGRGGPEPGELALSSAQPSITGVEAVRGQGAWIESADGRAYLDLAAGIATCNLGHSHPAVIAAVLDQMERVIHLGGVCGHAPQRDLAARLAGITPAGIDRFLFSTTGSEANEVALRLARTATGRPGVVCFRGSFHGRTAGALAATTSKAAFRMGLGAGGAHVAPFPRPDGLGLEEEAAVHALAELDQLHRHQLAPEETACYMIEPVQGHGGCHPAGRRFLEGLRERADAHGALLVFDEIQTGFGRTGDWFAAGTYGVDPDVMTMAKALGGGFPLSAIGARADVMATIRAGDHGSTFGGNPVSCAAALAGIDAMEAEGLPGHARMLGERAMERLATLEARHPGLRVRGLGLMIGIEVGSPDGLEPRPDLAEAIRRRALAEGVLVICSGPEANVIRVLPPLVITDSELDRALGVLEAAADAELAEAAGAGQRRPSSSR